MKSHKRELSSKRISRSLSSNPAAYSRRTFLTRISKGCVCGAMLINISGKNNAETGQELSARELYAPAHFGNSYEVLGEYEMKGVLSEAQYWGFNRYGDWFDMLDCSDPFRETHTYMLSQALWDRKKENFKIASSLGLACDLIITPNHVYIDQCLPEHLAEKGKMPSGRMVFGQLICPSKPAAREIIIRNYEKLFADLKKENVHLNSVNFCPYDYGGCTCEQCNPYILTFAKLTRDIHNTALHYHPGIEANFIGWWWSEEEHALFADWADKNAPGWANSMSLYIPYGQEDVVEAQLPDGCERRAFVHICYSGTAWNKYRDIYGHLGPMMAASRIERTVSNLRKSGCTGFMAYSEGIYDDVNKAVLAGLSSASFKDTDTILRAYAQRYFDADRRQAQQWAEWLKLWEDPFRSLEDNSEKMLTPIEEGTESAPWRLRQWLLKIRMFQLNAEISGGSGWTRERLALVEEFWKTQEILFRTVWGLGPQRHILARPWTSVEWYAKWAEYMKQNPGIRWQ